MTTSDKLVAAGAILGFVATIGAVLLDHLLTARGLDTNRRGIDEVKVLVNGNLERALAEVNRQDGVIKQLHEEIDQLRTEREQATEEVSAELHQEMDALRLELQRHHDPVIPPDDWLT